MLSFSYLSHGMFQSVQIGSMHCGLLIGRRCAITIFCSSCKKKSSNFAVLSPTRKRKYAIGILADHPTVLGKYAIRILADHPTVICKTPHPLAAFQLDFDVIRIFLHHVDRFPNCRFAFLGLGNWKKRLIYFHWRSYSVLTDFTALLLMHICTNNEHVQSITVSAN